MNRYFECENCGQVVQGWNASQQIECCEHPQYQEIDDPSHFEEPGVPCTACDGSGKLFNGAEKRYVCDGAGRMPSG